MSQDDKNNVIPMNAPKQTKMVSPDNQLSFQQHATKALAAVMQYDPSAAYLIVSVDRNGYLQTAGNIDEAQIAGNILRAAADVTTKLVKGETGVVAEPNQPSDNDSSNTSQPPESA